MSERDFWNHEIWFYVILLLVTGMLSWGIRSGWRRLVGKNSGTKTSGAWQKGVVSGFQIRQEQIQPMFGPLRMIQVWTFRLERADAEKKPLPRLMVEMRGLSFTGSIVNGDVVEVFSTTPAGNVIQVNQVRSLTAGVFIKCRH
ncbi:MAG: hypothetical protein V4739_16530 [Pseudomonadota bacterium]